jgi:hypothetical protein
MHVRDARGVIGHDASEREDPLGTKGICEEGERVRTQIALGQTVVVDNVHRTAVASASY